MERLRDKKGRFIASGKPNKFNQKWIRRDKVTVKADGVAVENAYRSGFETARRMPKTFGVNECFKGFLENNI